MTVLNIVVVVAFMCAMFYVSEALSRRVYDTDEYSSLHAKVERLAAALKEARGKAVTPAQLKRHEKDIADRQSQLTSLRTALQSQGIRMNVLVGFLNIAAWWIITSYYAGVVMCRLPFEPFALFRGITHRGLEGEDWREASVMFVFVLCNVGLKPIFTRVLGSSKAVAGAGFTDMFNNLMEQQSTSYDKST